MPVLLTLNVGEREPEEILFPLLPKLPWTEIDEKQFNCKLDNYVDNVIDVPTNPQEAVNWFIDAIKASSHLGNNKILNKVASTKCKQKWFDTECRQVRKKCFALLNLFRNTNIDLFRRMYVKINKQYKDLIKFKKKNFYLSLCAKLGEAYDTKSFWHLIKNLKNTNFTVGSQIKCNEWFQYFKNLLNVSDCVVNISYVPPYSVVPIMDEKFQLNELLSVLKKAKNGKAPGFDRVPYEFFKNSPTNFLQKLLDLFNFIYDTALVPESFVKSIVFPLYKNGNINDVQNYRGISFSDCISKLFTGLLLERLQLWINENDILNECQAGFRRGYSANDQIFNLFNIIKLKTRKKRQKLYCFFIDFKSAFDSPERNSLYYKLYAQGVSCKFIEVLRGLYGNTESAVWTQNGVTASFNTMIGLKQGVYLVT